MSSLLAIDMGLRLGLALYGGGPLAEVWLRLAEKRGLTSDVDLALTGIDDPLHAEAIARELDELPLPFRFDVQALTAIQYQPLLDHIARVGVKIYG